MSDSDASLYDEVIEGLRCNREAVMATLERWGFFSRM